ncbi:protein unc-93 homolog A isoform X2 [Eptesicus fuscus]|uniref:protein unc-93 homolog A isoform X2 n=1 Tax=Eptesicus fuscus TaxID=29078 RepID=UPI0024046409|nr:protein unc-93 homolog A isoform X2 [Eptesicus fuscus]
MDRSLRNVLVVALGFLLLFTAYGGLQSLQSSLYSDEGLGVTVLSTLYGAVLLSSMLLPPLLIRTLGCKWTIVLSMGCYVAFSLGNFYASWYTLIPTSILLGLGAAPLWSAQSTYLTVVGNAHAEKAGKAGRDVVNQYFGIFFLLFQSSGVWGNLISSLVFGQKPTQGSGVLAVLLVALFLDPIRDTLHKGEGETPSVRSTLLSTLKLLRDRRLRLLVLLPLYSGFEQAFLAGDYTRSYTTCALGIHFVGYVMICFAATNALCSELYGKVARYTGRAALYAFGAATHLSCIVALLLWEPRPGQLPVFFVFSGLWGVADAVWQTQNNVLFGVLFDKDKEAAFANYRLWEALGFVVAFGYSTFLCVRVKLYILLAVLSAAMLAYAALEVLESRARPGAPTAAAATPAEAGETQTKM